MASYFEFAQQMQERLASYEGDPTIKSGFNYFGLIDRDPEGKKRAVLSAVLANDKGQPMGMVEILECQEKLEIPLELSTRTLLTTRTVVAPAFQGVGLSGNLLTEAVEIVEGLHLASAEDQERREKFAMIGLITLPDRQEFQRIRQSLQMVYEELGYRRLSEEVPNLFVKTIP